jgi:hypothetical protein
MHCGHLVCLSLCEMSDMYRTNLMTAAKEGWMLKFSYQVTQGPKYKRVKNLMGKSICQRRPRGAVPWVFCRGCFLKRGHEWGYFPFLVQKYVGLYTNELAPPVYRKQYGIRRPPESTPPPKKQYYRYWESHQKYRVGFLQHW